MVGVQELFVIGRDEIEERDGKDAGWPVGQTWIVRILGWRLGFERDW